MIRSSARRLIITLSVVAAAASTAAPAIAGPYSGLVVFGDSLSDDGNNAAAGFINPSQPVTGNGYIPTFAYASGTYSNGPVWANYFASAIGVSLTPSALGGSDYAFGGATTGPAASAFPPSLLAQTSAYLAHTGNVAPADALFVIEGGGNNARAALATIAGGGDIGATTAAASAAFASDVGSIVDALQAAGAQHIVVWDTPNIGLAPAVVAGGGGQLGSFIAGSMNVALGKRLAGEPGVVTFDIYGLGTSISNAPATYGFVNATDACGAASAANCSQYVYWDGIHPTTAADRVIADAVLQIAAPVPEPQTWALLAVGLGVVALGRRRSVLGTARRDRGHVAG